MALQFGAAVVLLNLYSEQAIRGIVETSRALFQQSFRRELSVGELQSLAAAVLRDGMFFVFPLGLTLVAVGLLMHLSQTGFVLSAKKLTLDFNRLNPLAKLRDLPGENLTQTLKAIVLLPLFGVVLWQVIGSQLDTFLSLAAMAATAGSVAVSHAVLDLLMKAAVCLVALGLFDLYRQRRRLGAKLRMTKEEVRREHKDLEGDPHIKARLRRLRREMSRAQGDSGHHQPDALCCGAALRAAGDGRPGGRCQRLGPDRSTHSRHSGRAWRGDRRESAAGADALQFRRSGHGDSRRSLPHRRRDSGIHLQPARPAALLELLNSY